MAIELTWLGQSGLRLDAGGTVVYVDPYLSDSVEHNHGVEVRKTYMPGGDAGECETPLPPFELRFAPREL